MAKHKNPRQAPKRKLPRRKKTREDEFAKLEQIWRRNVSAYSSVSDNPSSWERVPAGRNTYGDLRLFHKVTGDPAFEQAADVLAACGLMTATSKGTRRRLQELLYTELSVGCALELMFHALRSNPKLSVRKAAQQAGADFGVPGSCLASVTDRLRKLFAEAAKRDDFFKKEPVIGDTGKSLMVLEQNGQELEVPDNSFWRKRIAGGEFFVRFLGRKPP